MHRINPFFLYHLVRAGEQSVWNRKAKRLGFFALITGSNRPRR
jgi:hypothetical protein